MQQKLIKLYNMHVNKTNMYRVRLLFNQHVANIIVTFMQIHKVPSLVPSPC